MNPAVLTLLIAVGAGAASVAALRLISRHHVTACPAWLVPLLENPYMNALAGAGLLLDRARVSPGMSVIDVGAGPGRLAIPAARRVGPEGRVVALDLQPAMIRRLEQRLPATSVRNIETLLAGAGEGRMPIATFDRAFLVTVLGEIVDQETALREIYRSLKPGGILSVTEVLPDPHYQSRRRVRRLAEAAGFSFVERLGPWYAFTMNFSRPDDRP
jgi:ubiquinone/menaquinone biosynthesis C-methylase UbiE